MNNHFTIDKAPNRKILLNDKEYDFYSGTSYLGMNQDTDFKELLFEGINRYGMSFGSSRNGNLQLAVYEEAEEKLAKFVNAEAALTLSSGMMAGQVVAQYLKSQGATFFYAPQTHAANFYESNIILPDQSFQAWSEQIVKEIFTTKHQHSVIVCNSNDALKVQPYNFDWTLQLPDNQVITLIIDDSHGLGITGKNGAGIYQQIARKSNIRLVVVSSLHKAMGIAGGVVFSDSTFIDALRHTAFFASCSPIAPAYLYAYIRADKIYQRNLSKLQANIQQFELQLGEHQNLFNSLPNYPVFYTVHHQLYDYLMQKGIFIYNFAYPIKTGIPNTRIVLSAWHDATQIDFLTECIRKNKFNRSKTNNQNK